METNKRYVTDLKPKTLKDYGISGGFEVPEQGL